MGIRQKRVRANVAFVIPNPRRLRVRDPLFRSLLLCLKIVRTVYIKLLINIK